MSSQTDTCICVTGSCKAQHVQRRFCCFGLHFMLFCCGGGYPQQRKENDSFRRVPCGRRCGRYWRAYPIGRALTSVLKQQRHGIPGILRFRRQAAGGFLSGDGNLENLLRSIVPFPRSYFSNARSGNQKTSHPHERRFLPPSEREPCSLTASLGDAPNRSPAPFPPCFP